MGGSQAPAQRPGGAHLGKALAQLQQRLAGEVGKAMELSKLFREEPDFLLERLGLQQQSAMPHCDPPR